MNEKSKGTEREEREEDGRQCVGATDGGVRLWAGRRRREWVGGREEMRRRVNVGGRSIGKQGRGWRRYRRISCGREGRPGREGSRTMAAAEKSPYFPSGKRPSDGSVKMAPSQHPREITQVTSLFLTSFLYSSLLPPSLWPSSLLSSPPFLLKLGSGEYKL